jgi:hypothetical protein
MDDRNLPSLGHRERGNRNLVLQRTYRQRSTTYWLLSRLLLPESQRLLVAQPTLQ